MKVETLDDIKQAIQVLGLSQGIEKILTNYMKIAFILGQKDVYKEELAKYEKRTDK